MQLLGENLARENGLRAYLVDLPGHGDNTDAFSFARAQKCAAATVETLIRSREIDPKQTVLVGHSMGAAIAISLADIEPVASTIAISPAPLVLPHRMPANLLVFSARYDISPLKQQAQALAAAAGGDRATTEDFLQLRAFHLQIVSIADHTSVLVDPRVAEQAANWIRNSFDGNAAPPQASANPKSVFASMRGACAVRRLRRAADDVSRGVGPGDARPAAQSNARNRHCNPQARWPWQKERLSRS